MTENEKKAPETEFQIALDINTIFKFECNVEGEKIILVLKQTNIDTPYYYEKSFTLEELYEIHPVFKACKSLKDAQGQFLGSFKMRNASLNWFDDYKKIEMNFKFYNISEIICCKFILERNP